MERGSGRESEGHGTTPTQAKPAWAGHPQNVRMGHPPASVQKRDANLGQLEASFFETVSYRANARVSGQGPDSPLEPLPPHPPAS
jgi:hypothetical protein